MQSILPGAELSSMHDGEKAVEKVERDGWRCVLEYALHEKTI